MPELGPSPTLSDFQRYVRELEQERGFSQQTVLEKTLLMGEEMGELFKAIRKREKIALALDAKVGEVDEELADVFIFLCSIANRTGVDLETAFRTKEEMNKTRVWK